MKLIFLGNGTVYPDPERRAPGLALRHGRTLLVFDSGPGTWLRLAEAGVKKFALTHFYPACKGYEMVKPAQKIFKGEVIAAQDLMRVKI